MKYIEIAFVVLAMDMSESNTELIAKCNSCARDYLTL